MTPRDGESREGYRYIYIYVYNNGSCLSYSEYMTISDAGRGMLCVADALRSGAEALDVATEVRAGLLEGEMALGRRHYGRVSRHATGLHVFRKKRTERTHLSFCARKLLNKQ